MKKNKHKRGLSEQSLGFKAKRDRLMKKMRFEPDVDIASLSQEMAKISSYIYRIGIVKAEAEAKMDRAKAKIDVMKAKVARHIKKKALEQGDKMTVPELEGAVDAHKQVIQAVDEHIDRKYEHNVCWAAFSSAQSKANQLTNLSMNYRKELDAGINSKVKQQRASNKVSKQIRER